MGSLVEEVAVRRACESAGLALRDRLGADPFGGRNREAMLAVVEACVPKALVGTAASHSKILGVASAVDGSYYAAYGVDHAKLAKGELAYGSDLTMSVGEPGFWRCLGSDGRRVAYEWRGAWDVRSRPWLVWASSTGKAGWTAPYADPLTNDLLESFVAPLHDDKTGEFIGVVVAGTVRVIHRGVAGPGDEEADITAVRPSPKKKKKKQQDEVPPPRWVELADPKMRSRLLYTNPVCLLTSAGKSADETKWRRNVMTISWLTPLNNQGDFLFSMNKRRHTAAVVVDERRAFGLSVPVAGMEALVLAVGGCSGRKRDKFSDIPGLQAAAVEEEEEEEAPPTRNAFAMLADDSSDDDGSGEGVEKMEEAPVPGSDDDLCFFVEGACARMRCHVVEELPQAADNDHRVCVARIDGARVHADYWRDGKLFAPAVDGAPPYLTFLGSQRFGYVAAAPPEPRQPTTRP